MPDDRPTIRPSSPASAPREEPAESAPRATVSAHLLVVEDHPAVQRSTRRLLESCGHSVVTAADGETALALLRSEDRFDAVLLDLTLPKMNGYQFRARQLAEPTLAAVPVIVLSGEHAPSSMERLRAAAILRKPFTSGELIETVALVVAG